jgi:hypothetical protein
MDPGIQCRGWRNASRIRRGHGAEVFSRLRRIALNLPKREKTCKAGIKSKRLLTGQDHHYLLNLLNA